MPVEPMSNVEAEMLARRIDAALENERMPALQVYRKVQSWSRLEEAMDRQGGKIISIPWRRWAVAAAFIAVMVTGVWLYYKTVPEGKDIARVEEGTPEGDRLPAKFGAILELPDGQVIILDTAANGAIAGGFTKTTEALSIEETSAGDDFMEYATLRTPKARIQMLALSDGTKVWLNAASSIKFPTQFKGATREVEITGEAYFEVAKNTNMPFIVHTRTDKVEVLGTHFNIMAYEDEGSVRTTLLEGSVKVASTMLRPGEQFTSGTIKIADVSKVMAWRNGLFSFDKADVKTVMRELSRWYDIEVKFEGVVSKEKFDGEIPRTLTLQQLMKGLSYSKIKFRMEDENTMVVLP